MAIGYTWDVSKADTYPSFTDGNSVTKSDVIYTIHWKLIATDDTNKDEDGVNISATVYGTQKLDVSDLGTFTDFSNVTLSQAQTLVENALGTSRINSLKASLDEYIEKQITPVSGEKTIGS